MLDVMAYNAFVLFKIKNPEKFIKNAKRTRCGYLIQMAHDLIQPCIDARYSKLNETNFVCIHRSVIQSLELTTTASASILKPS